MKCLQVRSTSVVLSEKPAAFGPHHSKALTTGIHFAALKRMIRFDKGDSIHLVLQEPEKLSADVNIVVDL